MDFFKLIDAFNVPLQPVCLPAIRSSSIRCQVARFDLTDPHVSGNKLYKLLPYLQQAKEKGLTALMSAGGIHSNHLHALASLGAMIDIDTIGIIKAYDGQPITHMLRHAKALGMKIITVSPPIWRERVQNGVLSNLLQEHSNALWVEEGGVGALGVTGAMSMAKALIKKLKIAQTIAPDYLFLSVGSGTTLAGFLHVQQQDPFLRNTHIIGIGAVNDRKTMLKQCPTNTEKCLNLDYVGGGFAKVNASLAQFMVAFESMNNVLLDPVYTLKQFFAVNDLIERGQIANNSQVICIHSGGLQGRAGLMPKIDRLAK